METAGQFHVRLAALRTDEVVIRLRLHADFGGKPALVQPEMGANLLDPLDNIGEFSQGVLASTNKVSQSALNAIWPDGFSAAERFPSADKR